MKKKKQGRKLGRKRNQRDSLLRSLARELFLKGRIKTTEAKAKEAARFAEKMITKAKTGNLHNRRLLAKNFSNEVIKKLVEEIGPRYKDRPGGYTRILKMAPRKSDGSKIAIIELLE